MTTTTLENVINDVHQQSIHHYDKTIPVNEMEFDSLTQMWVSGRQIDVLPSAQRLIANRLRVPFSYLHRCPQELQRENLNYWIEKEAQQRDTFFCRFDGNRLRAVFTERYCPLNNMEILSKLIENGFYPETKVQYTFDNAMFLIKIPNYSQSFSINAENELSDKIVPGVSFANSEVGLLAFSIEAFFYRLICTNGLIAKTAMTSKFKHISNRGLEYFPETLSNVIADSSRKQDQFKISRRSHVDNPIAAIETFSKQFGLSQAETEVVRISYYNEQGATMFHIINAFTAAAKTQGLTTAEVYKFEKVGGQILALVKP